MITAKQLDAKFAPPVFDAEESRIYEKLIQQQKKERAKKYFSSGMVLMKVYSKWNIDSDMVAEQIKESLSKIEEPIVPQKYTEKITAFISDKEKAALISDVVCKHFNLHFTEITAQKRTRRVVVPRNIIIFLTRWVTGLTLLNLSTLVSSEGSPSKDHSTILHSCKEVLRAIQTKDGQTYDQLVQVISKLLAKGLEIDFKYPPQWFSKMIEKSNSK